MQKRVLLLMPEFYGIEQKIRSLLEKSGYEVVFINNKSLPFNYSSKKAKLRFLRKIYFCLFIPDKRYLSKIFKTIKNQKFDILLSINCHISCSYLFRILKLKNPDLFSILYLWDSLSNYSWKKELTRFDRVFTFDKSDAERYKIRYKPNFFVQFKSESDTIEYDMFFIGKFSPIRLRLIDTIFSLIDKTEIRVKVILWPGFKNLIHHKIIFHFLRNFNTQNEWIRNYICGYEVYENKIRRDFFVKERLEHKNVHEMVKLSNVILDLPDEGQIGYTHRLIEALALGKKVLTTNRWIEQETFFNPEQIRILDISHPKPDVSWLKERKVFSIDSRIKDLELSTWLKAVIDEEFV